MDEPVSITIKDAPPDPVEVAELSRLMERQLNKAYRNYKRYCGSRCDEAALDFVAFASVFFQIPSERTKEWLIHHGLPTPLPEPTEKP